MRDAFLFQNNLAPLSEWAAAGRKVLDFWQLSICSLKWRKKLVLGRARHVRFPPAAMSTCGPISSLIPADSGRQKSQRLTVRVKAPSRRSKLDFGADWPTPCRALCWHFWAVKSSCAVERQDGLPRICLRRAYKAYGLLNARFLHAVRALVHVHAVIPGWQFCAQCY